MKTLAFYAVFGLMPGYNNRAQYDKGDTDPKQMVAYLWQQHMNEEFVEKDILVAAVVSNSLTVYPIGFGCPPGGEVTVTITGHVNPKFLDADPFNKLKELRDWKKSVVAICEKMKEDLEQLTVSIAFYPLEDFIYLTPKKILFI